MKTKEAIRSTMDMSLFVLNTYLSDFDDADLMRRPAEGCNHLAWQLGHLISSEAQLVDSICPGKGGKLPDAQLDAPSPEMFRKNFPTAGTRQRNTGQALTYMMARPQI
jgi:hypothetical protein